MDATGDSGRSSLAVTSSSGDDEPTSNSTTTATATATAMMTQAAVEASSMTFGGATSKHSDARVSHASDARFPIARAANGVFPQRQQTAAIVRCSWTKSACDIFASRLDISCIPLPRCRFPLSAGTGAGQWVGRFPCGLDVNSWPGQPITLPPTELDQGPDLSMTAAGGAPEAIDAMPKNSRQSPNDASGGSDCGGGGGFVDDAHVVEQRQPTDIATIGLSVVGEHKASGQRAAGGADRQPAAPAEVPSLSPPSLAAMTQCALANCGAEIQVQAHSAAPLCRSRRRSFINDASISAANAINTVPADSGIATIASSTNTSASVGAEQRSSAFGDIFREAASGDARRPQSPLSGQIINDDERQKEAEADAAAAATTTTTAPPLRETSTADEAAPVGDDDDRDERLARRSTDPNDGGDVVVGVGVFVGVDVDVGGDVGGDASVDGTTIDGSADNELSTQLSGGCSDVCDTSSQEVLLAIRAFDLAVSETWSLRESVPETQRQLELQRSTGAGREEEPRHRHRHRHRRSSDHDRDQQHDNDNGNEHSSSSSSHWVRRNGHDRCRTVAGGSVSDTDADGTACGQRRRRQEAPGIGDRARSDRVAMTITKIEDNEEEEQLISGVPTASVAQSDGDTHSTSIVDDFDNDDSDTDTYKYDYNRAMKFEMKSAKGALPSATAAARLRSPIKTEPLLRSRTGAELASSVRGYTARGASETPTLLVPSALGLTPSRALSVDAALETVLPARTLLRRQRRMLSQDVPDQSQPPQQPPEDPIERLNRLRARISGALSEVKGVLQQYSTETEPEGVPSTEMTIANGPEARPNDDGPVTFRFVRKVRRRSIFNEEEEDKALAASAAEAAAKTGDSAIALGSSKTSESPEASTKPAGVCVEASSREKELKSGEVETVIANEFKAEKRNEEVSDTAKTHSELQSKSGEAAIPKAMETQAPCEPKVGGGPPAVDIDSSAVLKSLGAPAPRSEETAAALPVGEESAAEAPVAKTKPKRRLLPMTSKDGVRRASIAAVEGSKIEPPVKPAIPLAVKIQRRPSDSEAVIRRRNAAKLAAGEGQAEPEAPTATPAKVKIVTKVVSRRASAKGAGAGAGSSAAKGAATTTPAPAEVNADEGAAAAPAPAAVPADIEDNRGEQRARSDEAVPTTTTATRAVKKSTQSVIDDAPLTTILAEATTTTTPTTPASQTITSPANEAIALAAAATRAKASVAQDEATKDSTRSDDPNVAMVAPPASPLRVGESSGPRTPSSPRSPSESASAGDRATEGQAGAAEEASAASQQLNKLVGETVIVLAAAAAAATADHVRPPTTPATPPAQGSAKVESPVTAAAASLTSTTTDRPASASTDGTALPIAGGTTKASDAASAPNSVDEIAAGVTSQGSESSIESKSVMPELQVVPAPVKALHPFGSAHAVQAAPFNVPKDEFAKKLKTVVHKKVLRKNSIEKPPTTTTTMTAVATPTPSEPSAPGNRDKSKANGTEATTTTGVEEQPQEDQKQAEEEAQLEDVVADAACPAEAPPAPPKKPRKVKKKVIIKRQQRRLSISDSTFFKELGPDDAPHLPDVETLEKAISYVTDDEDEDNDSAAARVAGDTADGACAEEPEPPKPLKTCMRAREYEIGDWVMYAERFKKTQVRWKKGRVMERITSISYKLDIDGKEVPAHVSYIKRFTDRKVNFGGKEYLEIDYEQIAEEERKVRTYSIWNMV